MLGVLAAMLMQAATPAAAPPRPSVITNPDWAQRPTAQDLANLYPKAAAAAHVEGRATIHCSVLETGELTACRVTGEDPPGQGFGDAALAMAPKFKMKPQTRDGVAVSGGQINIPIRFGLPKPAPLDLPSAVVAMRCYGYAAAEAERNPASTQAQMGVFAFGALVQMSLARENARPSEVAQVLLSQRKIATDRIDDPKFNAERDECGTVLPAGGATQFQQMMANLPR